MSEPIRLWSLEPVGVDGWSYVESIRTFYAKDFERAQQLGAELETVNDGRGYGGCLRAGDTKSRTPATVSVTRGVVLGDDDGLACAGWVSNTAFGLPTALDLGSMDGRNISRWDDTAPQGLVVPSSALFLGSHSDNRFEMARLEGDVRSLDVSHDGNHLAVIEYWGWLSTIGLRPVDGGPTFRFAAVRLGGIETVRFSPDDRYLLISPGEPLLVDTNDGRVIQLSGAPPHCGWWPGHGSTLLGVTDRGDAKSPAEEDVVSLVAYHLDSSRSERLGPLTFATGEAVRRAEAGYFPEVDPTGTKALVGSTEGVPDDYIKAHGSRYRVALLDIETRTVSAASSAFVAEDMRFERSHQDWRWARRPAEERISVADDLLAQAVQLDASLPEDANEFVGEDAHDVCLLGFTALYQNPGIDPHSVRPELLRAYEAVRRTMPESNVIDWVKDVCTQACMQTMASQRADPGDAWYPLQQAVEKIHQGDFAPVHWNSDSHDS